MKSLLPVIAIIASLSAIVITASYHLVARQADADEKTPASISYTAEPEATQEVVEKKVDPVLSNVSASALHIIDADSGAVVFSKNASLKVSPASTTKMMTALVAVELYDPISELLVPKPTPPGSKMGLLMGERISSEALLYGMLVKSANDAAETLAANHPEGREAFIALMNQKASLLGMESTFFVNPTGLDNINQTTSARDMAILGMEILKNPLLSKVVATKEATVYSNGGTFRHYIKNTNELLSNIPGVLGIKTGWTEDSGENLVTFVKREEGSYIISLFDSASRFEETQKIIEALYKDDTGE